MEEKLYLSTLVLESRNFNQFSRNGHPSPDCVALSGRTSRARDCVVCQRGIDRPRSSATIQSARSLVATGP